MRFLALFFTLMIIGYAMHVSLGSSSDWSAETKPKQQIDQSRQAADLMNQALQRQQEKFDHAN